MRQKWICEKCGEEFLSEQECLEHEKNCDPEEIHTCVKCGKVETWKLSEDECRHLQENWHQIDLGRMGYGSKLDGCDVNFEICDDCLCEIIDTFKFKEDIYNSGSNHFFTDDDLEDFLN